MSQHPWEVEAREIARAMDSENPPLLVDCREPSEILTASIEGTMNIPMGEISARLPDLEAHADRDIVVMCHHGVRSLQVVAFLRL